MKLIDAEVFESRINNILEYCTNPTIKDIIDALHKTHGVDAKLNVHAHWIKDKNNYVYHYICSNCHEASEDETNYCFYCGAIMDEVV